MKKKVAMTISTGYYLRNFLPKTLHRRSLGHCRKEARSLGHYRRQMKSLGPRSRGVTLSRGVPLAITISHHSSIDLLSPTTNRQVLTSKSFPIWEDTSIRKGLQGTSTRRIWNRS